MDVKKSRLPSKYQEVEYLESTETGTQYIDTDFIPNFNTKVEADFEYVGKIINTNTCVMGARSGQGSINTFMFWVFANSNYNVGFSYNGKYKDIIANTSCNKRVLLRNDRAKLYYNNKLVFEHSGTSVWNGTCPLYVFNLCNGGVVNSGDDRIPILMKLYGFKVWNVDTLVRNFVPCYCKTDNELGLYDLVEGKFYKNKGTGNFVVGGNV